MHIINKEYIYIASSFKFGGLNGTRIRFLQGLHFLVKVQHPYNIEESPHDLFRHSTKYLAVDFESWSLSTVLKMDRVSNLLLPKY